MIAALTKAVGQIGDPRIRGTIVVSTLAALVILAALSAVSAWLLLWGGDSLSAWLFAGDEDSFWQRLLEWLLGAVAIAAVIFASFLLFPSTVGIVVGVMLERVAGAVEARHYPGLPPARDQPVMEAVRGALGFAGVTIAINLLALPLYLALSFLPPLNFFVFYMVNAYLLGREYFEMVAVRRLEMKAATQLRRRSRGRVFLAGVVIAILLTIPLVNILTPVVATAFMVHVFEALRGRTA